MDLQNIAEGIIEDLSKLTEKKTNADRIRAMTDDELAEFLMKDTPCDLDVTRCDDYYCDGTWNCKKCIMDWLQLEVES